jgi:hypothetical protein
MSLLRERVWRKKKAQLWSAGQLPTPPPLPNLCRDEKTGLSLRKRRNQHKERLFSAGFLIQNKVFSTGGRRLICAGLV